MIATGAGLPADAPLQAIARPVQRPLQGAFGLGEPCTPTESRAAFIMMNMNEAPHSVAEQITHRAFLLAK